MPIVDEKAIFEQLRSLGTPDIEFDELRKNLDRLSSLSSSRGGALVSPLIGSALSGSIPTAQMAQFLPAALSAQGSMLDPRNKQSSAGLADLFSRLDFSPGQFPKDIFDTTGGGTEAPSAGPPLLNEVDSLADRSFSLGKLPERPAPGLVPLPAETDLSGAFSALEGAQPKRTPGAGFEEQLTGILGAAASAAAGSMEFSDALARAGGAAARRRAEFNAENRSLEEQFQQRQADFSKTKAFLHMQAGQISQRDKDLVSRIDIFNVGAENAAAEAEIARLSPQITTSNGLVISKTVDPDTREVKVDISDWSLARIRAQMKAALMARSLNPSLSGEIQIGSTKIDSRTLVKPDGTIDMPAAAVAQTMRNFADGLIGRELTETPEFQDIFAIQFDEAIRRTFPNLSTASPEFIQDFLREYLAVGDPERTSQIEELRKDAMIATATDMEVGQNGETLFDLLLALHVGAIGGTGPSQ